MPRRMPPILRARARNAALRLKTVCVFAPTAARPFPSGPTRRSPCRPDRTRPLPLFRASARIAAAALNPGARFCTVCGTRVPEAPQGQTGWYASAPGGAVSSPEIGAKHKPKKLLIGLLCGFAALVVIAAVLIGLFAAHGGSHGTTGNTEVDQLIERYFTYFENDDISGMNKIFLPEAVAFMRDDDDGLLTVEEAIEELDDWYDDYGRTIDDYDIYDSDRLDKEDLTQLEWALDVRIDDNLGRRL